MQVADLFGKLATEQQALQERQLEVQRRVVQQAETRGKLAAAQREIGKLKESVKALTIAKNVKRLEAKTHALRSGRGEYDGTEPSDAAGLSGGGFGSALNLDASSDVPMVDQLRLALGRVLGRGKSLAAR